MEQPLTGRVIPHRIPGDTSKSLDIVHDLIDFMAGHGLDMNIWESFYPAYNSQCVTIEGIPANVWWGKYVMEDLR